MDYEKMYKEILEWARKNKARLNGVPIEEVLPELAESEDEKIRKWIIAHLENNYKGNYWATQAIAWLEKQKEQKPVEWSDTDNIGWDEAFACVTRAEKSAKNEEELQNAVTAEKWLKEIKFKYCVHPVKQEWSEEDKNKIESIKGLITMGRFADTNTIRTIWKLLDSLRPQPQGTYKQVIHTIFGMLKDKDFYEIQPSHRVSLLNDIRVKCKDAIECAPILDEPHWKPSEEDIKMLEHIIGQYETGNKNSKVMGYLPRVEELDFLKKVLAKWKNLLQRPLMVTIIFPKKTY